MSSDSSPYMTSLVLSKYSRPVGSPCLSCVLSTYKTFWSEVIQIEKSSMENIKPIQKGNGNTFRFPNFIVHGPFPHRVCDFEDVSILVFFTFLDIRFLEDIKRTNSTLEHYRVFYLEIISVPKTKRLRRERTVGGLSYFEGRV